ncbi:hypothetical protein [Streptomyces globisporus]|uniref:hypothetical protein n=1 Tax=Streptomyces globisporus TaxID=1908 RepID=UPI0036786C5F
MTAAMELAERGFEVTVVEPAGWGGKARSAWVPGTGRGGRLDLPSEHRFRFLPGIYRSLPGTLRRIPVDGSTEGVAGDLREATQVLSAQLRGVVDDVDGLVDDVVTGGTDRGERGV